MYIRVLYEAEGQSVLSLNNIRHAANLFLQKPSTSCTFFFVTYAFSLRSYPNRPVIQHILICSSLTVLQIQYKELRLMWSTNIKKKKKSFLEHGSTVWLNRCFIYLHMFPTINTLYFSVSFLMLTFIFFNQIQYLNSNKHTLCKLIIAL